MAEESASAAYDRGREAGTLEQRLLGVEEHLVRNNGSIAEQVTQTAKMLETIQTLTAAINGLAAEVKAKFAQTEAVNAEGQRRRTVSEKSWSLAARFAIAGGVLILAAVLILVLQ
jgi:hypothetical protein